MRQKRLETIKNAVCRTDKGPLKDQYFQDESWRVFHIMSEFVDGFELLKKYDCAVTFFGSARCGAGQETYAEAEELAGKLSKQGFAVITGGASGIMEAANKGAFGAGGQSVGLNIELPHEQGFNKYLTDSHHFHYFFTRKVMLSYASEAYIFFPGGFGTLDEFFELITLIQTKKIDQVPVVLVGKEYWTPLLKWVEETVLGKFNAISKDEMNIYHLADSVDDAYKFILTATSNIRSVKKEEDAVPAPTG